MRFPSDAGYRQLFSFPELAHELLCAAVAEDWARNTGVTDFMHVNASYVAPNGVQRHDDIVWRVDRGGRPCVHLLVEFQSRPDKWMTTRMLGYAALLLDDLLKQAGATHGGEPLLLPVVLYSGREPWPYPTALGAQRADVPTGLESVQPELNYVLVSQSNSVGVIQALLQLDHAELDADFPALIQLVADWLGRQRNGALTRTMTSWIKNRMRVQFPGTELARNLSMEEIAMTFQQSFRTYTEMLEYRTLMRGREEGREEGREKGRQEGLREGWQEGRQEGQQEGRREALLAERRNTLKLLAQHAGMPLSAVGLRVLETATPEQMLGWIHVLLDSGELPGELARP